MSEVAVIEKKPSLKYKYKEFASLAVWLLQKFGNSDLISQNNLKIIYEQMKLFADVDAQTAFYEEFIEGKKDNMKAVAQLVKAHNKPVKVAREKKPEVEADSNKPKRGRAKKVSVVIESPEDNVIAQLVAAANNTENIVTQTVVVEAAVPVVEEVAPVIVTKAVAIKSKKPVAANADEKAAAKAAAEQEKLETKARLEQVKALAKFVAEQKKAADKAELAEKKAAAKLAAEQEKAAKAVVAANAKAAKEVEKAGKEAAKTTKASKKPAVVVPVVVVPAVELVAEEPVENIVIRDGDDTESEGGELEGTEIEQDGKTYLVTEDGDVYDDESNAMEHLIYFEGRVQER